MKKNIQFLRALLLKEIEDKKMCKECGAPMEEGQMCTECGYMEEEELEKSAHSIKADKELDDHFKNFLQNIYKNTPIEKVPEKYRWALDSVDETLHGKQKDIDVAPPFNKITGADFKKLKSMKSEGDDHEVSMANNSLKSIISSASELLNKIGHEEKDIPAWIQDHITNAENYINQASKNYHEYESGGEEDLDMSAEYMQEDDDEEPSMSAIKSAGGSIAKKRTELTKIISTMKQLAAKYKAGDTSVVDQLKKLTADKKRIEAELLSTDSDDDDTSLMSLMEAKKKKPSAGLSKKQKSAVAKKARAGKDVGKKGKGFAAVEKKAKESGADNPKAVAAAAMWKGVKSRAHKK